MAEIPSWLIVLATNAGVVILLWYGVLKAYKEVAEARKAANDQLKEDLADRDKRIASLESAYSVALVEMDTRRLIKVEDDRELNKLRSGEHS